MSVGPALILAGRLDLRGVGRVLPVVVDGELGLARKELEHRVCEDVRHSRRGERRAASAHNDVLRTVAL